MIYKLNRNIKFMKQNIEIVQSRVVPWSHVNYETSYPPNQSWLFGIDIINWLWLTISKLHDLINKLLNFLVHLQFTLFVSWTHLEESKSGMLFQKKRLSTVDAENKLQNVIFCTFSSRGIYFTQMQSSVDEIFNCDSSW